MIGIAYGRLANPKLTFTGKVKLRAGVNKISLLSAAVGLPVSYQTSCISMVFQIIIWMVTIISQPSII